jgi:RecA-family ATPase
MENGFLRFLETCFHPGEFVAIAPAKETEDGEIAPTRGVTLTREEWKAKATDRGGIERCFSTKLGLFIRVNPMRRNGAKNEDVTAFRHVLVEFDRDEMGAPVPKEAQYATILSSGLPVAVLIDSGNKSLHAWVRVDAPDAAEYKRRVDMIWGVFDGHALDKQNRNPSRLSRCPGGRRTVDGAVRVQKLLALNFGTKSWDEWETARQLSELGEPISLSGLSVYDTTNDPNNVLGKRWLCRGSSLVLVGQSGIGKSSLCMQLMILWALGLPAFNIVPIKPLRSLLIQAENDQGDLAEMYQGVRQGMALTPKQERLLDDRIVIYRDTTHTGEEFTSLARRLVEHHRPDIAWADPLLNYIGDDISEQKVIAEFCCQQLNAIALDTGVIWCLLHHTGKPSKDPKSMEHWTASDLAYSGLGSSALVNWSRETAVLIRVKTPEGQPPTFQLSMTKRRKRAGLRDLYGSSTDTIFLRHSQTGGICWEQCGEPIEGDENPGRYRRGDRPQDPEEKHFRTGSIPERYGVLFERMPPMANHRERSKSEVLLHIQKTVESTGAGCDLAKATRIFDGLRHESHRVLVFEAPCWKGCLYGPKGAAK